jgi:hypothetical protein
MARSMMVTSKMTRDMDMGCSNGRTADSMMDNGKTESSMVEEYIDWQTEVSRWVNGWRVSELDG